MTPLESHLSSDPVFLRDACSEEMVTSFLDIFLSLSRLPPELTLYLHRLHPPWATSSVYPL